MIVIFIFVNEPTCILNLKMSKNAFVLGLFLIWKFYNIDRVRSGNDSKYFKNPGKNMENEKNYRWHLPPNKNLIEKRGKNQYSRKMAIERMESLSFEFVNQFEELSRIQSMLKRPNFWRRANVQTVIFFLGSVIFLMQEILITRVFQWIWPRNFIHPLQPLPETRSYNRK